MRYLSLLICLALLPATLAAQSPTRSQGTEHTLVLDDPARRPAATIDQVAWIAGSWRTNWEISRMPARCS